jgi:hypothetical protein
VLSGTSWETQYGYSRAIRVGNRILVSGTTASHGDRLIGGSNPAAQAISCLTRSKGRSTSLGGRVGRRRPYACLCQQDEPLGGDRGGNMGSDWVMCSRRTRWYRRRSVGDGFLVEIEAEAGGRLVAALRRTMTDDHPSDATAVVQEPFHAEGAEG